MEIIKISKKINIKLSEKKGSSFIKGAVLIIGVVLVFLALMEYMRVSQTIISVKNAIDEAVIKTAVNNNYSTYHGRKQNEGKAETLNSYDRKIDMNDVRKSIENILGIDSTLSRYSNTGEVVFQILNLKTEDISNGQNLNFVTTARLKINMYIYNSTLPLIFDLEVHSRFIDRR